MGASSFDSTGPALEPLESRRFLSAVLVGGEVQIVGTHKADYIRVYINPGQPDLVVVQMNKEVTRFPLVSVQSLNILGGQGNDNIRVEGAYPRYAYPTRIYGSGGNDTIFGSTGNDRIYGGPGADSIDGHLSRDIIYGEGGNDSIMGFQGNDVLFGDDGNDTLIGEQGLDQLFAGAGDDLIEAGDTNFDRIDGGIGVDRARMDSFLDSTFSIETLLL
jgi:Ca2+-binding RTX toxin-like protein